MTWGRPTNSYAGSYWTHVYIFFFLCFSCNLGVCPYLCNLYLVIKGFLVFVFVLHLFLCVRVHTVWTPWPLAVLEFSSLKGQGHSSFWDLHFHRKIFLRQWEPFEGAPRLTPGAAEAFGPACFSQIVIHFTVVLCWLKLVSLRKRALQVRCHTQGQKQNTCLGCCTWHGRQVL